MNVDFEESKGGDSEERAKLAEFTLELQSCKAQKNGHLSLASVFLLRNRLLTLQECVLKVQHKPQ